MTLPPLLTGKSNDAPHDAMFWRVGKKNAVRAGGWKLIRDGAAWQLYDLEHDIAESTDLAIQEPDRVRAIERAVGPVECGAARTALEVNGNRSHQPASARRAKRCLLPPTRS